MYSVKGNDDRVWAAAISTDGKTVVSATDKEHVLKVWNLATSTTLRSLEGHKGEVYSVVLSPDNDIVITGSTDQTLKVWNFATGKLLRTLIGHEGTPTCVAISPCSEIAVSASAGDQTIRVWDLVTGKPLTSFTGDASFTSIAITADLKLFVGDGLGRLHCLDLIRK